MHRLGLAGAAEQGPPLLPALLCKKRFVRRAEQPRVANSGFNLPGIHPNKQAKPAGELGAQEGLTCQTAWSGEHHGVPSAHTCSSPLRASPSVSPPLLADGDLGMVLCNTGQHEPAQGFRRKQGVKPNSPAKPLPRLQGLGRKGSDGLQAGWRSRGHPFFPPRLPSQEAAFSFVRATSTTQINWHRCAKNNRNQ